MNQKLTARPSWKALDAHYQKNRDLTLRTLFAQDPGRGQRMTAEAGGDLPRLLEESDDRRDTHLAPPLAEESGLRARIDAMFRGEKINLTEGRAVLHVALRAPRGTSIVVDGENAVPQVHAVLDKMSEFADRRPERCVEGLHRQAYPRRDQHRHRGVRPRAGDGVRGAPALQRPCA